MRAAETTPASALPDAQLVACARGGDDAAFACLASRHKTWLFRFVRRYVGNDPDAYDLLQDSMLSAWLALERYDPAYPFESWLRQIALNKCRDWSRRSVVRRVLDCLGAEIESLPAPARDSQPEATCLVDETLLRLDRAISALPRGLREPFLLSAFEGLSHRETGELLGLSGKAVETRVYRARQQLQKVLGRAERPGLAGEALS